MADGRRDSNAVKRYIDLLQRVNALKNRRSPNEIDGRLQEIEVELVGVDSLKLLKLLQERRALLRERDERVDPADLEEAEKEFERVARGYSERKGIEYQTWRDAGVPPAVLRKAGVSTHHHYGHAIDEEPLAPSRS